MRSKWSVSLTPPTGTSSHTGVSGAHSLRQYGVMNMLVRRPVRCLICLQLTNTAHSVLQQLTHMRSISCVLKLHLLTGDGTSAEMCIAITQYYPKQATSQNCWGSEYEHANIGECEGFTVCVLMQGHVQSLLRHSYTCVRTGIDNMTSNEAA